MLGGLRSRRCSDDSRSLEPVAVTLSVRPRTRSLPRHNWRYSGTTKRRIDVVSTREHLDRGRVSSSPLATRGFTRTHRSSQPGIPLPRTGSNPTMPADCPVTKHQSLAFGLTNAIRLMTLLVRVTATRSGESSIPTTRSGRLSRSHVPTSLVPDTLRWGPLAVVPGLVGPMAGRSPVAQPVHTGRRSSGSTGRYSGCSGIACHPNYASSARRPPGLYVQIAAADTGRSSAGDGFARVQSSSSAGSVRTRPGAWTIANVPASSCLIATVTVVRRPNSRQTPC